MLNTYAKDDAVAFPAIEVEEERLQRRWQDDNTEAKKRFQKLAKLHDIELEKLNRWFFIGLDNDSKADKIKENLSHIERIQFDMLYDYLCWQYEQTFSAGGLSRSGNSSAKPKTLGDIAKQLLESRLNYGD